LRRQRSADSDHGNRELDVENKKIRIRGGAPSKIRLSTPYYLLRKDVDRYLAALDEYKKDKTAA